VGFRWPHRVVLVSGPPLPVTYRQVADDKDLADVVEFDEGTGFHGARRMAAFSGPGTG
jgi:hypothetical protein